MKFLILIFQLYFKSNIKISFANNIYLIKFHMFIFNKTSFYIAVENGDAEVVSVLLNHNKIDVNIPYIFILYDLIKLNNNII